MAELDVPLDLYNSVIEFQKYFDNRRNAATRKYLLIILKYLEERQDWVNVRNIVQELIPDLIPNESTFFRLIGDLSSSNLILRREDTDYKGRGKAPVYYKIRFPLQWLHPQLQDDVDANPSIAVVRQFVELEIAKELLRECDIEDPDAAIKDRFDRSLELIQQTNGMHDPLAKAEDYINSLASAAKEMSNSDSRRKPLGHTPSPRKMEFTPAGQKKTLKTTDEQIKSDSNKKSPKIKKSA